MRPVLVEFVRYAEVSQALWALHLIDQCSSHAVLPSSPTCISGPNSRGFVGVCQHAVDRLVAMEASHQNLARQHANPVVNKSSQGVQVTLLGVDGYVA